MLVSRMEIKLEFIPVRTDFSHKCGKDILILWRGQVLHGWKPIDGLLICCGDVNLIQKNVF
jgi:hypothetical protein